MGAWGFTVKKRVSVAAVLIASALILVGNQNCSPVGFSGSTLGSTAAEGTSISTTGVPRETADGNQLPLPGSPASPTPAPGTTTQIPSSPGPGPFVLPIPGTTKERIESEASSNSWCGNRQQKLTAAACLHVKGAGTNQSPYEVYTARDFACIEDAPDAHWNVKADVTIRPGDYQKPGGKRFIPLSCFGGVLDGEFHKVRHEIDCTAFDCTGETNVGKDASLIGSLSGVIMNLHVEADFRNMKEPYKHYSQYATGIAISAKDAILLRVDVKGTFDFQGQGIAGIFTADNESGSLRTLLEQVSAEIEARQITSYQPQYFTGLIQWPGTTTISNSISKFRPLATVPGLARGGLTMEGGAVKVRNSYHVGDFIVGACGEINGARVQPMGTTGTFEKSFYNSRFADANGTACSDLSKVYQSGLARSGAALTGVFDEFGFDDQYWSRAADGLPRLKWLE